MEWAGPARFSVLAAEIGDILTRSTLGHERGRSTDRRGCPLGDSPGPSPKGGPRDAASGAGTPLPAGFSHPPELPETLLEKSIRRDRREVGEPGVQVGPDRLDRPLRVAVGAAERLLDDPVHETHPAEIVARELQGLGRLRRLLAALPEDRGTALGRDDAVIGVLEDAHPIRHSDPESSPGS